MLTHAQKVKILQEVSGCSETPELLRLKLTEYWLYLGQVKNNHVHTDYDHMVLKRFNDLTSWSAAEKHVVLIPETLYFLNPKIDETYHDRANRLRKMVAQIDGIGRSEFFGPTAYFGWNYYRFPDSESEDKKLSTQGYPLCCADFIQHLNQHVYNGLYSEIPRYPVENIKEKVRNCFSLSRWMHIGHVSEIIRIFVEETNSRAKLLRLFFGKGDISKLSCTVPTWLFVKFTDEELEELDKKAAEWCHLAYDYFDLLITLWDYIDNAGVGDIKRLVKDYKGWMQK